MPRMRANHARKKGRRFGHAVRDRLCIQSSSRSAIASRPVPAPLGGDGVLADEHHRQGYEAPSPRRAPSTAAESSTPKLADVSARSAEGRRG